MDTKELKKKICKEYGVQPSAVCVYQNEHGTFVQMYNARTKEMKAVSEKDVEGFFINIMFENNEIHIITGISYKTFILLILSLIKLL